MAHDFREYLEEATRHEKFGRFYKEIALGLKIVASIQASDMHACAPAETLDDPKGYSEWEVSLRQTNKPIDTQRVGVWSDLKQKSWAEGFDRPEFARFLVRENVPTAEVQTMFDDLVAYALEKGQLDNEDEIRLLDPDEPIKKVGKRCGSGCSAKK